MNIRELNEAIKVALSEEDDAAEKERQALNDKLYAIVPYALVRTKDIALIDELYSYFDDRYEVAWQGGIRGDNRGMILCYWIDSDEPDTLCLYLTSDHNILFMSGSTHWRVPAKTFEDKVEVIKQIKKDVDEIVANIDKRPKTLYGKNWSKIGGNDYMCSLSLSEKSVRGSIGCIIINGPSKDKPKWNAYIKCNYINKSVEGDSIEVLNDLKEAVKNDVTLNLLELSDANINESVSIKEDKETMTIQKALKEIKEYYSDDELAEMDEEELRERLGETIERVLIYNEDVIDLWKAMWMESSASSSVLDEITSDVRSYLENEALEILKPKTKAE